MENILDTPIEYLKGVGPVRAAVLNKYAGISNFNDLLNYFPFRYLDKSNVYKIKDIVSDSVNIQLLGVITNIYEAGEGPSKRLIAELQDDTGTIELVWFKGLKWLKSSLKTGYEYFVFGKPVIFRGKFNIPHPEMELSTSREEKQIKLKFQPVYSTTEGLTRKGLDSKGIMKLQYELLTRVLPEIHEILPLSMLKILQFPERAEAYRQIHFPTDIGILEKARERFKFEEFFFQQFELLSYRRNRELKVKGYVFSEVGNLFKTFFHEVLPFQLTEAQKRVIREIRNDMKSGKQMNRLLQGDVGSGKTIVALLCMLIAADNGFQSALMAPTEILAQQHFKTVSKLLSGLPVQVALITGSTSRKEKTMIIKGVEAGEITILIGTHALIEDDVRFRNLGFAVIDEQHKFGVAQRAKMWLKSEIPPHVLIMTATPIPRTLAMTFYGDLDTSVIDELPPGRKNIITRHVYDNSREQVYDFIRKKILEGRQVYIVFPLIEESEKLDLKNLMDGYEQLKSYFPEPHYRLGIVHGRMKTEVKDREMEKFVNGTTHILVSTTVIEVGVDVPNATVMVIESAEKFGLSQLHQLRGRVGRGGEQSFCILMSSVKLTHEARKRLETMTATTDGFKIAEVDLELRGPGELTGTQQSGVLNFRIASLATDQAILQTARKLAKHLIDADPLLTLPEHIPLKKYLSLLWKNKFYWGKIS
ncbi:MAG: ATP-dependent DNA helicase RecG [Sphingobacteriales bacterium]|nr:ATP-dependent DNA helicase RecG [Sphingobacteriales bacterium]